MDDLCIRVAKIPKTGRNMKFFLESCKERSKLSVDGFWGRWDRLVAQKSKKRDFLWLKLRYVANTPPVYLPA